MTPAQKSETSGRMRIPADVERPDKLLAGLTARQLVILAAGALVLWGVYVATRHVLPLPAFGALGLPIAASGTLLALGRVEGMAADRWVAAWWRHLRTPRLLVPAPDGIPAAPAFVAKAAGAPPAPLRLPIACVSADGVVDLGTEGFAISCRASAVTFSLRTEEEQEALVLGFARFCNSLAEPVQVLVRAAPLDVRPVVDALVDAAPGLPHVALERAARDHARFLEDLAASRDLLRREVLVCFRTPRGEDAASRLRRRVHEATTALAAAGVALRPLDGPETTTLLAGCLDPAAMPEPVPGGPTDEPVRLAAHPTSAGTTHPSAPTEGADR